METREVRPRAGEPGDSALGKGVEVKTATFTPQPGRGQITTTVAVGRQEATVAWPLGDEDRDLSALIDRLTVRVQSLEFVSPSRGNEIRVSLELGGRPFVVTLPIDEGGDVRPMVDNLLAIVGQKVVAELRSALDSGGAS
jgi:hypothetical protein